MKQGDRFLLTATPVGQDAPTVDLCEVTRVTSTDIIYRPIVRDVFGPHVPVHMPQALERARSKPAFTEAIRTGHVQLLTGIRLSSTETKMAKVAWEIAMGDEDAVDHLRELLGVEKDEVEELERKLGIDWTRGDD